MQSKEIMNKILIEDMYTEIDSAIQTHMVRHPDTDLEKESSRRNIAEAIVNRINDLDVKQSRNAQVLKLLEERLALGQLKYNQDIPMDDGRDWLQESLEEVLDSLVYITNYLLSVKNKRDDNV